MCLLCVGFPPALYNVSTTIGFPHTMCFVFMKAWTYKCCFQCVSYFGFLPIVCNMYVTCCISTCHLPYLSYMFDNSLTSMDVCALDRIYGCWASPICQPSMELGVSFPHLCSEFALIPQLLGGQVAMHVICFFCVVVTSLERKFRELGLPWGICHGRSCQPLVPYGPLPLYLFL